MFEGWEVKVFAATPASKYPVFCFDEVNKCDLFVLGGGNLVYGDRLFFYSPFVKYTFVPAFLHRWFLRWDWPKKIKVPKIILGCGLNTNKLSGGVVKTLNHFDYIGLRDNFSVSALKSFGELGSKTSLFYDCAFANKFEVSKRRFSDVAVVVPTDRLKLNAARETRGWLRHHLSNFKTVMFVPFGQVDNDDYQTCKALASGVNGAVVLKPPVSFGKAAYLLSSCGFAVSYRLHGMILAYMAGTKYIFYPYHMKLRCVHETLAETSLAEIKDKQRGEFRKVLELIK